VSAFKETNKPEVDTGIIIKLYVAGHAPNSDAATANLRSAIALFPNRTFDIEIVDVLKTPERALRDSVVVTPMLIKLAPAPERRILGNLRDLVQLLSVLGLDQEQSA
jgi:circadian clock protein KaiB